MAIDYPTVMDSWYEDATEGDLSGSEVTAGRAVISSLGEHDAAMEYYRLSISNPGQGSCLTKGDARALIQALRDDPTV